MNVVAFSTPRRPDWRWRIVNYAGEIVEESQTTFPSISSAVAEGAKRRDHMNATDRSTCASLSFRSTSHLRTR